MILLKRKVPNVLDPTLVDTKKLFLDDFSQPKYEQQGVLELIEVWKTHGESSWVYM